MKVVNAMNANTRGRQIAAGEAAGVGRDRERMSARRELIESMIRNNEMQLKNECARGGAEIERACARRDAVRPRTAIRAQSALKRTTEHLRALEEERQRLVAEREWFNASLLEFESGPSAGEHQRAGHA